MSYEGQNLKNEIGYKCSKKIFVAARVEKRHIEDKDVHFLFACQEAPLLLNFFVIASQTVGIKKLLHFPAVIREIPSVMQE